MTIEGPLDRLRHNYSNGRLLVGYYTGSAASEIGKKGRLPQDISASPNKTYADKGWKGYGDWLGTGAVSPRLRKYRPFVKARVFAHKLKLKSTDDRRAFCKGEMPQRGTLHRI